METFAETGLEGAALDAWRSYLQSHASIVRVLDADLAAEHGMTTRDYEVLLYLSQADGRRLPMSALAESTRLTDPGSPGSSTGSWTRGCASGWRAPTTPACPTPS
jgi:hypothetical protein